MANTLEPSACPLGWLGRLTAPATGSGGASLLCRGVAKLVKASDFDSDMRGFESFLPCQTSIRRLAAKRQALVF